MYISIYVILCKNTCYSILLTTGMIRQINCGSNWCENIFVKGPYFFTLLF